MRIADVGLPVIVLEVNGTTTELFRTIAPSGEVVWAGHTTVKGQVGRFALVMDSAGKITGQGAINFVAAQGWGPAALKASPARKAEIHAEIVAGVVLAVQDYIYSANTADALEQTLASAQDMTAAALFRSAAISCQEGEMSPEQEAALRHVGVSELLIQAVRGSGLAPIIEAEVAVAPWVNFSFAKVAQGPWDDEAHKLALACGLPGNIVALLQTAGVKLARAA